MKKDSLIKGTMILVLAAFVARVLGVVQRVPLKHLLGDAGMASYTIAYNIYAMLLIVATAGIPSALSKLVSERSETGRMDEARRLYRAAMSFAVITGLLLTAVLILTAPYYASNIAEDPDAMMAIRALAPAMLLFPMIAMMRGYFQGLQFMLAGGISQIIEQILRVATAVVLAYVLLELGFSHQTAVAGASFGGVMGAVGAFGVMLYYYWRNQKSEPSIQATASVPVPRKESVWPTYKLIFAYSIPITFSALAVPIINVIDSSTVIPLLKVEFGYNAAKEALGILGARAQSLAGIPIIIAIAVSQTALPVISSAFARGDQEEVNKKASQALWLSSIFGLLIVLAIVTAARPVNGFIFGDTKGTSTIIMMTIAAMLQIVMMTTASILNGLGKMKRAAAHVYIGIAVKVVLTLLLSRWIGMYGVIGSTFVCFLVITLLNFRSMRKDATVRVLKGRWGAMLGSTLVTLAVGFGIDFAAGRYMQWFAYDTLNYMLQSIVVGAVACGVFVLLLFKLGVVRAGELELLPARIRRYAGKIVRAN